MFPSSAQGFSRVFLKLHAKCAALAAHAEASAGVKNRGRLHLSESVRCRTNRGGLEHRFYGRMRLHFRARVRGRPLSFEWSRFYEAEVKRCERSQRANKAVSISPSAAAVARPVSPGGEGDTSGHPVSPSVCRDNGIHLSEEEELLKRYLKRRLLPNGRVLRRTGC